MRVLFQFSAIALRQVFGPGADAGLLALGSRFTDRSAKLLNTLKLSHAKAWKAIEIALAGTSWWERCKLAVSSGEQYAFRGQVQAFLDTATFDQIPAASPEFRRRCMVELKAARKAGLLPGDTIPRPEELDAKAHALSRFEDTRALLQAELQAVALAADELRNQGYSNLSQLVSLAPPTGQPLLVVAVQYFFRKEVQADPELAAELQFHEFSKLSETQEAGFQGLHLALAQQGERLESLLESALEMIEETRDLARETRDDVRLLREEMARRDQSFQAMYQAMAELLARQAAVLAAPVAAAATPAEAAAEPEPSEDSIAEMRSLVEQCDSMPAEEQHQHQELFKAVGKLKATVQSYDAKRKLRRNVLPSALFSGAPAVRTFQPQVPVQPLLGEAFAVELPCADADADLPTAEEFTPAAPPPNTVKSIFGQLPKSKLRRTRPGEKPTE